MDEFLFRSSQKIENFQVQLDLAANRSKDVLHNISEQSKAIISQAWHSGRIDQLRDQFKEMCIQIIAFAREIQTRTINIVNPYRIYSSIIQICGGKFTRTDVCFGIAGFCIGGAIGLAVGLAIRKSTPTVHYMQAIEVDHFLGIHSATVVEDAIAPYHCGDYDVLVNVKAGSVQIVDAHICTGYGRNLGNLLRRIYKQNSHPIILGRDCTGVITDIGSKVKRLDVGDEVWLSVPFWSQGTLCQTVLVSENRVARKPKSVGFEGACSLPYAGSIALGSLDQININAQNAMYKRILIHGGCTPIGCILIQILKHWNATVTTTCFKRALPVVTALGAEDIIVLSELPTCDNQIYSAEEFNIVHNAMLKELEIRGSIYDVIINTIDIPLNKKEIGQILNINGNLIETVPEKLLSDNFGFFTNFLATLYIRTKYILMSLMNAKMTEFDEAHLCYGTLDRLSDLVEEGHLQTVVEKVFHPHDIEMALTHIQSPFAIGSTIITFR